MSKSDDDWRIKLFGDSILLNGSDEKTLNLEQDLEQGDDAVEQPLDTVKIIPTTSKPIAEFFQGYEYIALFFGANYCPFCKKFAPHVIASKPFLEAKKCKVIFVSNDRDLDNFHQSCSKVHGIDVMQYDTSKTAQMRDLFGLKTIPALMILRNDGFEKDAPHVYSNARDILESDPECQNFPWGTIETNQAGPVTAWERIWIHGRHGNWWQLGHKNVSDVHPKDMYMDEHAVRMRAGLLNVITWTAVMNTLWMRDQILVKIIFGLVAWEFVTSMVFGLVPFAPLGWIASIMSVVFQPAPLWKPARPKRFAWLIGLTLATTCFILVQFQTELGSAYRPAVVSIALTCNLATWLEGNAGFCVGCFLYNNLLVKHFKYEECKECKL
jgi:thiol-disulfide isomerase/thioredoxin